MLFCGCTVAAEHFGSNDRRSVLLKIETRSVTLHPSATASRMSVVRLGTFSPRSIGDLLAEHRANCANHAKPLWAVIVLQYWLENWT